MRLWDQTCDIEQLDGDEASASLTGGVVRLARTADLVVRTSFSNESHPSVRLDCREGIVCNLDRRERRRSEEGGLANVRFPDDPQLHGATNVMLPQVPLAKRDPRCVACDASPSRSSLPSESSAPPRKSQDQNDRRNSSGETVAELGHWHDYVAVVGRHTSVVGELDGQTGDELYPE